MPDEHRNLKLGTVTYVQICCLSSGYHLGFSPSGKSGKGELRLLSYHEQAPLAQIRTPSEIPPNHQRRPWCYEHHPEACEHSFRLAYRIYTTSNKSEMQKRKPKHKLINGLDASTNAYWRSFDIQNINLYFQQPFCTWRDFFFLYDFTILRTMLCVDVVDRIVILVT